MANDRVASQLTQMYVILLTGTVFIPNWLKAKCQIPSDWEGNDAAKDQRCLKWREWSENYADTTQDSTLQSPLGGYGILHVFYVFPKIPHCLLISPFKLYVQGQTSYPIQEDRASQRALTQ